MAAPAREGAGAFDTGELLRLGIRLGIDPLKPVLASLVMLTPRRCAFWKAAVGIEIVGGIGEKGGAQQHKLFTGDLR